MSPAAYILAARQREVEPILKLSRNGFGRYRAGARFSGCNTGPLA